MMKMSECASARRCKWKSMMHIKRVSDGSRIRTNHLCESWTEFRHLYLVNGPFSTFLYGKATCTHVSRLFCPVSSHWMFHAADISLVRWGFLEISRLLAIHLFPEREREYRKGREQLVESNHHPHRTLIYTCPMETNSGNMEGLDDCVEKKRELAC